MRANINGEDPNCSLALGYDMHRHPCAAHKPTHVMDPYKNADTHAPSDARIHNSKCLYNIKIKSWVHPAIRASQTQFPSDV